MRFVEGEMDTEVERNQRMGAGNRDKSLLRIGKPTMTSAGNR